MTVEVVEGPTGATVEVYSEPPMGAVEVTEGAAASVVEVWPDSPSSPVEVLSVVVGIPGPRGVGFITVAPGQDPPAGTPDRTFVFEGPL